MINKNDLRKAISSIAISNAKRNTIYKAFSDLDSITKEEFDSVKSDISKVVESMLTKDTVGKANGVASLDSNGSVPIEQLGNIDTTLFLIVRELPTADIKSNKIYLVPNQDGQGNNVYIEYLYVEDVWEKVGEFKPDIDYNEILNKVKEVVVAPDSNLNILGGFDENGNKRHIENYYSKSVDIGINNLIAGDNVICIGNGNDLDDVGEAVIIGQNTLGDGFDACIAIGTNGTKVMAYDIILGTNIGYKVGVTSIGYFAKEVHSSDKIIYQIGGYDGDSTHKYNLEETLDYNEEHKKYIYGIGNYEGLTTDDAKSLQEVLDDKIETLTEPDTNSFLYNDGSKVIKYGTDSYNDEFSLFIGTTYNDVNKDNDFSGGRNGVLVTDYGFNIVDDSNEHYVFTVNKDGITKKDGKATEVFAADGTLFDLTAKADTSAIPTKTSQLTNDSSFATEDYVVDNISNFKYIAILNYNNTISGLFDENGKSMDTWFKNSKSIIIGFSDDTDLDDVDPYNTVSIGNNVSCKGDSNVYIGNEVESSGDNNVLIGRNITCNNNNNVIIGSMLGNPITNGYIGIGYDIYSNINAIYQIAGHGGDNQYSLEETLTYDNQHKKYIYGIGGYDGTNSDAEGVKSLQEVLADKADVSAYYTKIEIDGKGYLTAHQSLDAYAKKTEIPDVSTKADLINGKLKADQLPKLVNITTASTAEEVVTKFNALLADLKAKGYMEADTPQ